MSGTTPEQLDPFAASPPGSPAPAQDAPARPSAHAAIRPEPDGWTRPEPGGLPASTPGLARTGATPSSPPPVSASVPVPRYSPFALDDEDDGTPAPAGTDPYARAHRVRDDPAQRAPTSPEPLPASAAAISAEPSRPSSSGAGSLARAGPGSATASASASTSTDAVPHARAIEEVRILDAHKAGDAKSAPYIVYVSRAKMASGTVLEAARRYSEFEAFRQAMVRLYPVYLVPPIPDKHSLAEYAVKQTRAADDVATISRRKRMLQSFLVRLANHPVLSQSEVLKQFLDGRMTWAEISASSPLSRLPRSNLRAPTHDVARVGAAALPPNAAEADLDDAVAFRQAAAAAAEAAAYDALPTPPASTTLRNPNKHFQEAESFTDSFTSHLGGTVEKVNRRLHKRWQESAADAAELGAVLNAFSLTESGSLAVALERCGQASDTSYVATGEMLQVWQEGFSEPLHEYAQYGTILQQLLAWRHRKHAQVEAVSTGLESRRAQLEQLEAVDAHTGRLTGALARGGRTGLQAAMSSSGDGGGNRSRDSVDSGLPSSGPGPNLNLPFPAPTAGGAGSIYGGAAEDAGSEDWVGATDVDEGASTPTVAGNGSRKTTHHSNTDENHPESSDPTSQYYFGVPAGQSGSSTWGSAGARPAPVSPTGSGGGGRFGTSGLLGALGHTLSSMLDVDPESTRRATAARLRGQLAALEGGWGLAERDLEYANRTIQADLDRFQRTKVVDFRAMLVRFARAHRAMAASSLEAWQEAQKAVEDIPSPPGMPESSLLRHQQREGSAMPR